MSDIVVVGAGAAGLMAAAFAASGGGNVTLLEHNDKVGKKIYITGKGRCNVTNNCDDREFLEHVVTNPKFLYHALHVFSPQDMVNFLEGRDCPVKLERGSRVFPVSDHASDVTAVFSRILKETNVKLLTGAHVLEIKTRELSQASGQQESGLKSSSENSSENEIRDTKKAYKKGHAKEVTDVIFTYKGEKKSISADAVILATGGCSYPATGSKGDGYRMAEELGHTVIELRPALVPFVSGDAWCGQLQGLSLKNVKLSLTKGKKTVFSKIGEMLFTDRGISGPLVLAASSFYRQGGGFTCHLDLKPGMSTGELDARLLREFSSHAPKEIKNVMPSLFPSRLAAVVLKIAGLEESVRCAHVTEESRRTLAAVIKDMKINISSPEGFEQAIVTGGGISVREVNPSTMESKLVRGLYFGGEILDVDALTGGFNLQIAWSTGYVAGTSAAEAGITY